MRRRDVLLPGGKPPRASLPERLRQFIENRKNPAKQLDKAAAKLARVRKELEEKANEQNEYPDR